MERPTTNTVPSEAAAEPPVVYRANAVQMQSFRLDARPGERMLSAPFWQASVLTDRLDQRGKTRTRTVYRRKCLNETHARNAAAEFANRYQRHYDRTGQRWEDRKRARS